MKFVYGYIYVICAFVQDWDTVQDSSMQPQPTTPNRKTITGLTRGFGQNGVLWTDIGKRVDVDAYFSRPRTFLQMSNQIENWHNNVHVYVGGDMLMGTSPNDPAFYMHHCNVDKLWWEFQMKQPNVRNVL